MDSKRFIVIKIVVSNFSNDFYYPKWKINTEGIQKLQFECLCPVPSSNTSCLREGFVQVMHHNSNGKTEYEKKFRVKVFVQ